MSSGLPKGLPTAAEAPEEVLNPPALSQRQNHKAEGVI